MIKEVMTGPEWSNASVDIAGQRREREIKAKRANLIFQESTS